MALNQALGVEVFHNFTLLHDDIMDHAPIRRNQPTVHEKWDVNIAILSGDAMLVKAYQLVLDCDKKVAGPIGDLFSKTALEVCEGQQLDMDFSTRDDVTIADYLHMIKLKTAVLLGCSLKLGAIQAGASEEDQQRIYDFGLNMGIGFQLQDDILDAFGDAEKFGKRVGGDIIEGKKTYLHLAAMEKAADRMTAANSLRADEKVSTVVALYEEHGVRTMAEQTMNDHFDQAFSELNATSASSEAKEPLIQLARSLMVRES